MKFSIVIIVIITLLYYDVSATLQDNNNNIGKNYFETRCKQLFQERLEKYKQMNIEYNWNSLVKNAQAKRGSSKKVPVEYVNAISHALKVKDRIDEDAQEVITDVAENLNCHISSVYYNQLQQELLKLIQ